MKDGLLKFTQPGSGPPGGYRYTFPETGVTIRSTHWDGWFADIEKHYRQNGIPKPDNWRQIAMDQCCRLMPPGVCTYETGEMPEYFVNARFKLNDVVQGTKVLAAWTTSGFPLVSREVAEERAKTCAACYANIQLEGCSSCTGFANIVAEIIGPRPLAADAQLENKSCAYCHCASRANVWVPVEVSKAGVTPETLAAMPKAWCWKRREIEALSSSEQQ